MLDSKAAFLTPENAQAKLNGKRLKEPAKKAILEEKLAGCTPGQKKFLLLCLTHPHLSELERQKLAGYKPDASRIPALKQIQGKLGELLLEIDVTEKDLAVAIKDGLKAVYTRVERVPIYKKGKIVNYEWKTHSYPDHKTRQKYLDMLLKHGSYFPSKVKKHDHTHRHTVGPPIEELRDRERQLSKTTEIKGEYVIEQSPAG